MVDLVIFDTPYSPKLPSVPTRLVDFFWIWSLDHPTQKPFLFSVHLGMKLGILQLSLCLNQRCNRYETGIGIGSYCLYFKAWYRYQYFFCWWENPLSCIWIYKKKHFFFSSIRPNIILCLKYVFLWDQSSETIQNTNLTFQRQYVCIVSGKWDNTNTVFLGIQMLRQYSVLGDTRIVSPLLHHCLNPHEVHILGGIKYKKSVIRN
jgi:hypothetical protein